MGNQYYLVGVNTAPFTSDSKLLSSNDCSGLWEMNIAGSVQCPDDKFPPQTQQQRYWNAGWWTQKGNQGQKEHGGCATCSSLEVGPLGQIEAGHRSPGLSIQHCPPAVTAHRTDIYIPSL